MIEDDAFEPRNVDHMQDFGSRLGDFQEAEEPAMDLENLKSDRFGFLRQTDSGVTEAPEEADDDEIRCIQKVMQVTYNVNSTTQCDMIVCSKKSNKILQIQRNGVKILRVFSKDFFSVTVCLRSRMALT